MTNLRSKVITGFTLIEMLLVLVIVSMFIYMGIGYIQEKTLQMRIDRASIQMQQILNAGMAYYVTNGAWPADLPSLQGAYLPTTPFLSPWGQQYHISIASPPAPPPPQSQPPPQFYVWTAITAATGSTSGSATAAANVIAGTLPLAYTTSTTPNPPATGSPCTAASTTCYVVTTVNIPGQNLNNASAINFAGLYHHGACVPVPQCPAPSMTPQIMVVPVSVSGLNNQAGPNQSNIYPISSFTAYAMPLTGVTPNLTPPKCTGSTDAQTPICINDLIGNPTPTAYWRVCLQVTTEAGNVQSTGGSANGNANFGANVTLMAVTRCAIHMEPAGSDYLHVWSN